MPQQWSRRDRLPPGQYNNGLGYQPARVPFGSASTTVTGGPDAPVLGVAASGVGAGTYGDSTHVAQVTLDSTGRVSTAVNVAIAFPPSTLKFAQTADGTVANTAAETTLTAAGTGTLTIPANTLITGYSLKLSALGVHSATGGPTLQIKVKLGVVTLLDTGAISTHAGTNETWELRGFITCRTTGVTGTVDAQGFYMESGLGANTFGMPNTATATIDTTASHVLDVTATWGTASPSNSITCSVLLVEGSAPA